MMIKKIHEKNQVLYSLKLKNGFSLVELMVAVALGVFLVLGVTNILFSGQQSFNATNRIARVQENGQLARNMLVNDLKRARFMGANIELETQTLTGTAGPETPAATCNQDDNSWGRMVERGLFGIDDQEIEDGATYECITTINEGTAGSYERGDILTVRFASPWEATTFDDNTLYIRSSLVASWIFPGDEEGNTNAEGDPANDEVSTDIAGIDSREPIKSTHELITYSYYVGDSGRQCSGESIPSLFRVRLNNGEPIPEEIFPGIENFQVQFSMDGNNFIDADEIVDGTDDDTLPDWHRVVATQIWLLARSECPEGGFTDDDGTREMPDGVTLAAPDDSYRRQLYSSIISHRNIRD